MVNSLEVLADKDIKKALILAEAAALLHDMGKCDEKQLEQQAEPSISHNYSYKQSHLEDIATYSFSLLGESVTLAELIRYGMPRNIDRERGKKWLVRVLGYCHSAAHMEKEETYYLLKQTRKAAHSSNPFGYESEPLIKLEERLTSLPFDTIIEQHANFKQKVKEAFSYAVADTRRPINDVTLWNWGSITAALFKAALAGVLLENQDEQNSDKVSKKEPEQIQWDLLSIRFNGLDFFTRANRIPDLLAYKELVESGLDNVRLLLEEKYPLGTEIYRDENGSVFIVPDVENLLAWEDKQGKKLEDLIQEAFGNALPEKKNRALLKLRGEIVPLIELDENKRWGRKKEEREPSSLPISDYLNKKLFLNSDPSIVASWWDGGNKEDICSVCQVRPQGGGARDNKSHYAYKARGEKCPAKLFCQTCKALERKVCYVCEERRDDRTENWIPRLNTTVWLDEVADTQGRTALIIGKFGLEAWFDGTMLFYPQAYTDEKLRQAHVRLRELLAIENLAEIITFIKYREKPSEPYKFSVKADLPNITSDEYELWEHTFQVSEELSFQTQDIRGKEIIGDLLEKHYYILPKLIDSPADMKRAEAPVRLSRVWETTRSFWLNQKDEFGNYVGEINSRLSIQARFEQKTESDNNIYRFHTYDLKLRDMSLSVACTRDGEFLTVDNLLRTAILLDAPIEKHKGSYTVEDYKAAAEYIQSLLPEGELLDIELPTGYGSSNKALGKLRIKKVEVETTSYTPAIPILAEPQTFMALVPADKAIAVVDAIKEKYEREMGKVRNRLPLSMGVVFAGSRTPLPAILDAGRRMLRHPTASETWNVAGVDKGEWPLKVSLTLKKGERTIELVVPTIMGDQITEDVWYPYWCLKKDASSDVMRTRKFKGIDGEPWVHVTDLQVGDEVSYMPSHLDFELLDTAARRFEVSYDDGRRRGDTRSARPYCLEQLEDFKKLWTILSEGLFTSQIDTLVSLIETKRKEWTLERKQDSSVFEQMVCDIINTANWQEGKHPACNSNENSLYKAAISGQLADVADLYMHILKKKTEVDLKGEKQ
ncbi:MAG: CRISPR-associated protein Csx11 [Ktedonobacteraceae bacterium]